MSFMLRKIALLILIAGFLIAHASRAEDALGKADTGVANILFDYDGASEFATYRIKEDGFVDIVFARNTPDKLYSDILNKLQHHPDINGVLAGRGGPVCSLF